MNNKDGGRKWMWWSLATLVAFQLYFVRELLAAFALFAIGFTALALAVGSVYMLQKTWEAAIVRVAESRHPAVEFARRGVSAMETLARRGLSAVEDLARRPFRGPGSAAAR